MMRRSFTLLVLLTGLVLGAFPAGATEIVWDGGDGNWSESPNWNGGQLAQAVLGRNDGWTFGSGEIGNVVTVSSGHVTYDINQYRDFRFVAGAPENGGTLNLGGGPGQPAILSMDVSVDLGADRDGFWTQFNADTLNLNNGIFRRTRIPAADGSDSSGGLFQFGGIRGFANNDIKVNITNGGGIENSGQLTFGWYLRGDEAVGRKVTMTINNGYLDLTGSTDWDHLGGAVGGAGNADLIIHYGWDSVKDAPAGEQYAINFTGPGSITVDEGGILVVHQTAFTNVPSANAFDLDSILTPRTYQYLWDVGILQAKGQSGKTGAHFDDFFQVQNALGQADYKLISKLPAGLRCDLNGDGTVDAADAGMMFADWGLHPGSPADKNGDGFVDAADAGEMFAEWTGDSGPIAAHAVPEPSTAWLLGTCSIALVLGRRKRAA